MSRSTRNAKKRLTQRRTLFADGQGATKQKPEGSHRRKSGRHLRTFRDLRG